MPKRIPKTKILLYIEQCAAHPRDASYLTNFKIVLLPRLYDHGIVRLSEHCCNRQLVRKTITMVNHKLLHDATLMKVYVLDKSKAIPITGLGGL
jgi:hypothetical protein